MSKSLLGQVGRRDRQYLTSSPEMKSGGLLSECYLIELVLRPNLRGKPASWRAVLDASPMAFVSLESWWNDPVLIQPDGTVFSRSALVGYVADQDGGAHTDPGIDKAFQLMRTEAFTYTDGRSTTEHVDRHVIRQIAHEMVKSLRSSFKRAYQTSGSHAVGSTPRIAEVGAPEPVPLMSYHLLPAAAACPCGSGLTFAKCHLRGASPPVKMTEISQEFTAPPNAAYAKIGFGFQPQ